MRDLLLIFILSFCLPDVSNAQGQTTGSLRLVNSGDVTSAGEGRLEIYLNGQWGTICNNGFGATEATLACKQLGFRTYTRYGSVQSLGYPSGSYYVRIWISSLSCNSDDLTIYHCSRSRYGYCSHSRDVVIRCSQAYTIVPSGVRLISKNGATSPYLTAGRVDIFYVGRWGTICNTGFSSSDAAALCHILTGSSSVLAYGKVGSSRLPFAQGSSSSPVWIEDLRCRYSSSQRRYTCTHDGIGITDCSHSRDIAISCRANGAVRLISSSYYTSSTTSPGSSAGRLEIYYNGRWGTVCDDSFGQTDANVVCKQLGYQRATRYGNVAKLGYSRGSGTIWLTNVGCTSSDVFLANCSHNGFGNTWSCSHREDVAISCTQSTGSTTGTTLSVGGSVGVSFSTLLCLFCCGGILFLCICGAKHHSSSHSNTRNHPPPRTTVVSARPRPREVAQPASAPTAAVFMATKVETVVYKTTRQSNYNNSYTNQEAPPDYDSVVRYN